MVTYVENVGADDISVDLYVHDSVRPTVALKKLVFQRVKVTEEDLRKAYGF